MEFDFFFTSIYISWGQARIFRSALNSLVYVLGVGGMKQIYSAFHLIDSQLRVLPFIFIYFRYLLPKSSFK